MLNEANEVTFEGIKCYEIICYRIVYVFRQEATTPMQGRPMQNADSWLLVSVIY